mgnify:CR=1 FL=1
MEQKENPLRDGFLAEESLQGADDASAMPSRLDRYFIAHRRALHMADYAISQGENKIAQKLRDCGNWLLFRDYYTEGIIRLIAAHFCHYPLLCPLCAIRRGAKLMKAYLDRMAIIQVEQPGIQAYLVTVTVKNGPDLSERFRNLRNAMKLMTNARRHYLSNPKKNRHVEFAKAVGGVHSVETKRGQNSGWWHPHAHMIWLCHEAPDARKLSEEWQHWTGDSFIVDVRPFRNQDDLISGFLEVFKYAVKVSDMPVEDNWHAYETLKGKRLVDAFGCMRGVDVPEDLGDVALEDLPYIEMLYRYTRSGYTLAKIDGLHLETGELDYQRLSLADTQFYRDSHEKVIS